MESKDIINGSKLIAEYMGLIYLPFSAESERHALLKEKGMKAGYYKTVSAEPKIEKTKVTTLENGVKIKEEELNINTNLLRYHNKNGWRLFEGKYYKYVCRLHTDLRYWNSLDALVPVIKKIEREGGIINLHSNGCTLLKGDFEVKSFDLPKWSNNVFAVVVSFLAKKEINLKYIKICTL